VDGDALRFEVAVEQQQRVELCAQVSSGSMSAVRPVTVNVSSWAVALQAAPLPARTPGRS
jgi:hypothetical protein